MRNYVAYGYGIFYIIKRGLYALLFIIFLFIIYMTDDTVLFVFYELVGDGSWSYGKMPKGWKWIGAGTTRPVGSTTPTKYPREEQFNGPKETRLMMREYLDKHFGILKKDNVIKRYKIRNSYK